jgi:hypothetical protein
MPVGASKLKKEVLNMEATTAAGRKRRPTKEMDLVEEEST